MCSVRGGVVVMAAFQMLFMTSDVVVLGATLPDTISGFDYQISPTNASCVLVVRADGTWTCTGTAGGTWLTGGGTGSDYEVRLTTVSGTAPLGTLGAWLALSGNQTWSLTETRNGFYSKSFSGTLEIRMAASPNTVFDSASVSMDVIVEM